MPYFVKSLCLTPDNFTRSCECLWIRGRQSSIVDGQNYVIERTRWKDVRSTWWCGWKWMGWLMMIQEILNLLMNCGSAVTSTWMACTSVGCNNNTRKLGIERDATTWNIQVKLWLFMWAYITQPDHGGNWTRNLWGASLMLSQLSYEAKSVRVCGISELSLVPSIPLKLIKIMEIRTTYNCHTIEHFPIL